MPKRVAINGFGRIGRLFFRAAWGNKNLEIISINDLFEPKYLAYTLKYDTVFGRFKGTVSSTDKELVVDGKKIPITKEKEPGKLPHAKNAIDVVVESTGRFTKKKDDAMTHITAGAKRVLISAPSTDPDITIVLGCNDDKLKPEHKIVSMASCTTNCLAPVVKVLHESFKIVNGLMTTIHSYTNDQVTCDIAREGDPGDMLRGRAAAQNIIPTRTGAARVIGEIFPDLKGKLDGHAIRVPTIDGSLVDLSCLLEKAAKPEEINAKMKEYAEGKLKGILEYTEDPITNTDVIGNPASSVFSAIWTRAIGNNCKVYAWYDNEWAYSMRLVDLIVKKL